MWATPQHPFMIGLRVKGSFLSAGCFCMLVSVNLWNDKPANSFSGCTLGFLFWRIVNSEPWRGVALRGLHGSLNYLEVESPDGQDYLKDMQWCAWASEFSVLISSKQLGASGFQFGSNTSNILQLLQSHQVTCTIPREEERRRFSSSFAARTPQNTVEWRSWGDLTCVLFLQTRALRSGVCARKPSEHVGADDFHGGGGHGEESGSVPRGERPS